MSLTKIISNPAQQYRVQQTARPGLRVSPFLVGAWGPRAAFRSPRQIPSLSRPNSRHSQSLLGAGAPPVQSEVAWSCSLEWLPSRGVHDPILPRDCVALARTFPSPCPRTHPATSEPPPRHSIQYTTTQHTKILREWFKDFCVCVLSSSPNIFYMLAFYIWYTFLNFQSPQRDLITVFAIIFSYLLFFFWRFVNGLILVVLVVLVIVTEYPN